mmetsp:Transcript_35544/g.77920  ORF Transcript_35544/g.77920 Transcript_35544/m.77920 type:complete len:107 (-) Transcript_35544:290-610(-)
MELSRIGGSSSSVLLGAADSTVQCILGGRREGQLRHYSVHDASHSPVASSLQAGIFAVDGSEGHPAYEYPDHHPPPPCCTAVLLLISPVISRLETHGGGNRCEEKD